MTELKPCPFCGGEPTAIETHPGRGELYCGNCDVVMGGDNAMTPEELTAAWNTRATHGTLTAEQVREAWTGNLKRDCLYDPPIPDWQAIADELNAELGSGINGDTSDGYHTFNELYHHRAVLFSVIVRDHREHAWKARKHHDGTMYDGMFIVGIETPKGQATYHYDLDPYWEMFDCEEREFAPEWDGHTPDEAIARIAELGRPTFDANLEQALSFMRIWISEDAHLGESAISCKLEKAEGLRKLDAIESAIAATLGSKPPRTVYIVESYDSLMEGGYVEPTCYTSKEAAIRMAESLTYDDGGGVHYWARCKELKVAEQ